MNLWFYRLWMITALFVTSTYADTLPHFKDIARALSNGKHVSIVLDLSKCQGEDKKSGPSIQGGFAMGSYMNLGERIVFSDSHFTLPLQKNSPQKTKPIIEFVRYELDKKDNLTLSKTIIQLPDYQVSTSNVYSCALGYGVHFFE